ncbi:penicillin-binding protein [Hymenobacter psychrotolerans]|uniref:Cell division protein FtsI (Penicillin-binding protein 3) n=1 Tax=Hymenobacter psychrotolerans DSM 18569 TaxID=1121959 RepID=A0A1M6VTD1_9BACT|nr:penicillin-binding protein [Hymenobacter psychrotolerans]SHK84634.1 cell division protein FtsI (penicillin-binding protein 3) [Hymenobacter psychrotolerans DSM 18569]
MKGSVKKSIVTRVRLAFLGVCLFSCAVVWKISNIQFKEGERWRALEQERRVVYQPVFATRGTILADDGRSIMATSLPFFRVAWDPSVVDSETFNKGVDSLAIQLAHFFGDRSISEYKRKLKNAKLAKPSVRYIRLNSRQINYQEKKELAQWPIFREGKNKGGVIFEKVDKRFRPFGGLAQRTIGFVNEDKNGAGLEFTFNRHLAGKDGEALFERLPGGNKPIYDGTEVKPIPGYDVQTTLDINLQDVAENALYKSLVDNNAQYGCVILMEVQTGEIKAVANLGKVADGVYREDYNYAIADQGRTEPGSTFKLASMMALFEENPNVTLDDIVDTGNGRMYIGGAVKTDSHGYGKITVKQVFEKSSNIGIAVLVDKQFGKNPSRYTDHLKKFGLHKPLGFQMAGEARPYVKDPQDRSWSRTSLTTMSIGYELKLAPLQTLAFYNAIANGGVKVQPMIVREIKQADKVLERFEPVILNPKICSDETLEKVKAMMEGVVSQGTARSIRSEDFTMAGKTGTAWKFKNGAYTKVYSTSFCGYFPADKPKYSCIVVVDSPKKGRIYGADVAAPVFREVADKAMARDAASQRPLLARASLNKAKVPFVQAGMQDELRLVCEQIGVKNEAPSPDEDWVRIDAKKDSGAEALALQPLPVRPGRVPNVTGLTLRDALFLLENRGLRVRTQGTGRVKAQSVAAGTAVRRGTMVTLALAPIGQRPGGPAAPVVAPASSQLEENKLLTPVDTDLDAKARALAAKAKARLAATSPAPAAPQPKKKPEPKPSAKPAKPAKQLSQQATGAKPKKA